MPQCNRVSRILFPSARVPRVFFGVLLALLLAGCSFHPLGMSDEEWNRLTPEQQLEARKEDERNQLERERLRQEERQRREAEEHERDLAEGMILEYRPDSPCCIGGEKCPRGSFKELILSLKRLADVDRVVFSADDAVGNKHDGMITVLADGVPVQKRIDIAWTGSTYQVLVARPCRNITLRAVGDDEVRIRMVKVYGSWASEDQRYIIIK